MVKQETFQKHHEHLQLVGGFNPFEKYAQNWIISPGIRVKIPKIFELPPPLTISTIYKQKLPGKPPEIVPGER